MSTTKSTNNSINQCTNAALKQQNTSVENNVSADTDVVVLDIFSASNKNINNQSINDDAMKQSNNSDANSVGTNSDINRSTVDSTTFHENLDRQGGNRGGGSSTGNRHGCRVSGCTERHTSHYCRLCKSSDADHFSRHCQGGGGNGGSQQSGGSGSSRGGSSTVNRQGCRVSGCTERHTSHYCRLCKSSDADHFSRHCRQSEFDDVGSRIISGTASETNKDPTGGSLRKELSEVPKRSNHRRTEPRCVHFSHRLGHIPSLHARRQDITVQRQKKKAGTITKTEFIAVVGGATTLAAILHEMQPTAHIGLMVSGNGGRPGGACGGDKGHIGKLHSGHGTQEEDIISCWFLTECPEGDRSQYDALFRSTIHGQWGLVDRTGRSEDPTTIQGVDYVHSSQPGDYAEAWRVRECCVSRKIYIQKQSKYIYDTTGTKVPCELVFVIGPNAGASQRSTGTTARTRSLRASSEREYIFFKESVKCAVRVGLDAMIDGGCDIALVAMVSCGIYAGPHRKRINREFVGMVDELLEEEVVLKKRKVKNSEHSRSKSEKRGDCFDRIFIPLLCTCGERSQCKSCQKSMMSMSGTDTDQESYDQTSVKRDPVSEKKSNSGGSSHSDGGRRQGCGVSECTESHARHYCRRCKSQDSDHFSHQCEYEYERR